MTLWRTATTVAVALVLGVSGASGCGRDEGGAGTGTGGQPAGQEVGGGKATGEITVWAMGSEGEKLAEIAKDFEAENPEAKVTISAFPFDAAHDKIATAIAGRQTPDVSMIGTTWMGEFAKTGAFDQTPSGLIDKSKFFDGAWNTTVVNGTSFGVPWYVETRLIYYRTDLARQAGVEAPKDWQGLKDFARALKEKGGADWGINLQPGGTGSWQSFMPFAWQAGGEIAKDGAFTLDTPEVQKALEYYASFFKDGLSPTEAAPGTLEPGFVNGDIGAFISGPWHMGILKEQGGADFTGKWGVTQMPREQAGTSFIGGSDLVVFKDSKNRDTAWKFVEYLTRPQAQQKLYQLVGSLPAVKEAWETGDLTRDEMLKAFGEQLDDAKSAPVMVTWEQIADVIDDAIERVVRGVSDPATAAKDMQSKATSIGTGG